MQKVQIVLTDDIDGSPAYITVPFMWEGVNYEMAHGARRAALRPVT